MSTRQSPSVHRPAGADSLQEGTELSRARNHGTTIARALIIAAMFCFATAATAQTTSVGFTIPVLEVEESLFVVPIWIGRSGDLSQETRVELDLLAGTAQVGTAILWEPIYNPEANIVSPTRARFVLPAGISQVLTGVTLRQDNVVNGIRSFSVRATILSGADNYQGRYREIDVFVYDDDVPGADVAVTSNSVPSALGQQGSLEFFLHNQSNGGEVFRNVRLRIATTLPAEPCLTSHPDPAMVELGAPVSYDPSAFQPDHLYEVPVERLPAGATRGFRMCVADPLVQARAHTDGDDVVYTATATADTSESDTLDTNPSNDRVDEIHGAPDGCPAGLARCCALEALLANPARSSDTVPRATQIPSSATLLERVTGRAMRLFEAAGDLALAYRFRDRVLSTSPGGRRATELYYEHSDAMRDLLLVDAPVRQAALDLLGALRQPMQLLIDGRGDEYIVSEALADEFSDFLDLVADRSTGALRTAVRAQRERLDLDAAIGATASRAMTQLDRLSCSGSDTALCLGNRFAVEVKWVDFEGGADVAVPVPLTEDTGAFWFFDDENLELLVKTLDATSVNGSYWVFYGALSNVEYRLVVTDTLRGLVREYRNPSGIFGSGGDTQAFPADAVGGGSTSADSLRVAPFHIRQAPGTASTARGEGSQLVELVQGMCTSDQQTLCLGDGRFEIRVDWTDFEGGQGTGRPVPITNDSGAFWFFDDQNLELMVKVLDGRALNGRYWVYYGSLSNVGYRLSVRDTISGEEATYVNEPGTFASAGDTGALGDGF